VTCQYKMDLKTYLQELNIASAMQQDSVPLPVGTTNQLTPTGVLESSTSCQCKLDLQAYLQELNIPYALEHDIAPLPESVTEQLTQYNSLPEEAYASIVRVKQEQACFSSGCVSSENSFHPTVDSCESFMQFNWNLVSYWSINLCMMRLLMSNDQEIEFWIYHFISVNHVTWVFGFYIIELWALHGTRAEDRLRCPRAVSNLNHGSSISQKEL